MRACWRTVAWVPVFPARVATNDTPRGHQYHTATIVSPGARGRGRPGGTQQSKGIYSVYFCLLPLLLKLVNLDLDLDLLMVLNLRRGGSENTGRVGERD